MMLRSPAFIDEGAMPSRYTYDGADMSPPLAWSEIPPGTQSLALIMEDADAAAPRVHWILVDLEPRDGHLDEGRVLEPLIHGARDGKNDFDERGWHGPQLKGHHHFVFHLYALNTKLGALDHPSRAELERAMRGHVLDEARLTVTYGRP